MPWHLSAGGNLASAHFSLPCKRSQQAQLSASGAGRALGPSRWAVLGGVVRLPHSVRCPCLPASPGTVWGARQASRGARGGELCGRAATACSAAAIAAVLWGRGLGAAAGRAGHPATSALPVQADAVVCSPPAALGALQPAASACRIDWLPPPRPSSRRRRLLPLAAPPTAQAAAPPHPAEAPATGWSSRTATLDQQDSERHPLVPPSRDVQLRQRSGAAAGADPPGAAAEPEQPERPGSRSSSAPSSARAPGRQPYLPFGADPPESSGSGSGSLWRLAAGIIGVGGPAAAKRQEDAYQRRQAAKKCTTSEEVELTADSKGPRVVPVVVELEGGGYVPEHPAAAGGQRRVAFETTVELDTGGTAPLRTGAAGLRGGQCPLLRAVPRRCLPAGARCGTCMQLRPSAGCPAGLAPPLVALLYSQSCTPTVPQSRPTTAAHLCGEWGAWTGTLPLLGTLPGAS